MSIDVKELKERAQGIRVYMLKMTRTTGKHHSSLAAF